MLGGSWRSLRSGNQNRGRSGGGWVGDFYSQGRASARGERGFGEAGRNSLASPETVRLTGAGGADGCRTNGDGGRTSPGNSQSRWIGADREVAAGRSGVDRQAHRGSFRGAIRGHAGDCDGECARSGGRRGGERQDRRSASIDRVGPEGSCNTRRQARGTESDTGTERAAHRDRNGGGSVAPLRDCCACGGEAECSLLRAAAGQSVDQTRVGASPSGDEIEARNG